MAFVVFLILVAVGAGIAYKRNRDIKTIRNNYQLCVGKGHNYVGEYLRAIEIYQQLFEKWKAPPYNGSDRTHEYLMTKRFSPSIEFLKNECDGMLAEDFAIVQARRDMMDQGYLPTCLAGQNDPAYSPLTNPELRNKVNLKGLGKGSFPLNSSYVSLEISQNDLRRAREAIV